jgi:hypothetical protein
MGAIFAWAARLVRPFNATRANELAERAVRAYDYALSHGVTEDSNGLIIFATSQLSCLTGEQQYKDKYKATLDYFAAQAGGPYIGVAPVWPSSDEILKCSNIVEFMMGYLQSPGIDRTAWYYTNPLTRIKGYADEAKNGVETYHAHRNARKPESGPNWGYGTAVGQFMMPVYARLQLEAQDPITPQAKQGYLDAISLSADYLLGGNPNGMVWVTGLGSRYPMEPLHSDSLAFLEDGKGIMPGITVPGCTRGVPGFAYYAYGAYTFYPGFVDQPLMRHYADIRTFVVNNEGDFVLNGIDAATLAPLLPPGLMPPPSWLPGGTEHRSTLPPRAGITGGPTPPNPGIASAPSLANGTTIAVSYSGAQDATSGLKGVRLWVKKAISGTWQDTGLSATGGSGVFNFTGMSGDDTYYFATRAENNAGAFSAMPSGQGQTNTQYDATPPNPGTCSSPPRTQNKPIAVNYSGVSDNLSGVKEVRLWAKKGRGGPWQDTGQRGTTAQGSFEYGLVSGDDTYFFFIQAVDKAGNASSEPTDALVFGPG